MAIGIYKPGQGYWVRVMTATLAGVLILWSAAWLWSNLGLVPIPRSAWIASLQASTTGTAQVGQAVDLQGEPDPATGVRPTIGTAVVAEAQVLSSGQRVTVKNVKMTGSVDPTDMKALSGAGGAFHGTLSSVPVGVAAFSVLYVQAAGVAVLVLLGTVLIVWFVGIREGTSEFLIATDGEMKKVNWSTYRGVKDSTWVVILWSVLIAGGLFLVDFVFAYGFKLIGVLEK